MSTKTLWFHPCVLLKVTMMLLLLLVLVFGTRVVYAILLITQRSTNENILLLFLCQLSLDATSNFCRTFITRT